MSSYAQLKFFIIDNWLTWSKTVETNLAEIHYSLFPISDLFTEEQRDKLNVTSVQLKLLRDEFKKAINIYCGDNCNTRSKDPPAPKYLPKPKYFMTPVFGNTANKSGTKEYLFDYENRITNPYTKVKRITVCQNRYAIGLIQFWDFDASRDLNGIEIGIPAMGTGDKKCQDFNVEDDDFINTIEVQKEKKVVGIRFLTNKGNKSNSPLYGKKGSEYFVRICFFLNVPTYFKWVHLRNI